MVRGWIAIVIAVVGCGGAAGDGDAASNESSSSGTSTGTPPTTSSSGVDTSSESSSGSTGDGPDLPDDETDVIRVQVDYDMTRGYTLGAIKHERSGTSTLGARASSVDPLGSFAGVLSDPDTGAEIYRQTLGTGLAYAVIARGLSFRFPAFDEPLDFTLFAETPNEDTLMPVLEASIDPAAVVDVPVLDDITTMVLREATQEPSLQFVIYAEGYDAESEDRFFYDAGRVVFVLEQADFPGLGYLDISAVYRASLDPLGEPEDLGEPVPVPDSFLGMRHPYWADFFMRWQQLAYPVDEEKFRDAVAQVPYDYPFVLIDSDAYWGTGNFNAFVAVPAANEDFAYLVEHETAHYFGLQEEYSTGGTELIFAPGVEPWSQNLSFATELADIKWHDLIEEGTPIPTPSDGWKQYGIGAYAGGYGGLDDRSRVPTPEGICTMSSGPEYCDVCRGAITAKLEYDLVGAP